MRGSGTHLAPRHVRTEISAIGTAIALWTLILIWPAPLSAEDAACCDPMGPFSAAETSARHPATCETIGAWIDRAPDGAERINLTISGVLSFVGRDDALAYLVMCPPDGVQILCVAYQTNGMQIGDTVVFGGGFSRAGPDRIILDPCLAYAE